ncbi:MAG: ABC transporter ATP-binding protein [Actinomycetota bacterium]|nr:ABC transporter ATP-binding protein [Actinomycetota bacterium]
MNYIVCAEDISKSYGSILAVDKVSFTVREGEFFSLLGPSGCGKTTILRILGGFIEQDGGTVSIDGKDMKGIPPNRRDTAMVFQNLALFPHMDVRENIVYGLRKRKFPADRIREELNSILEIVDLKGFETRRISELSGGQQQRVALARSLIVKPKILLLDEPLASLDKKLRVSMQGELKEIQKRIGTTFLYVTHDQGEALTMSDNIAVMNKGVIIQMGTPDSIYNCPWNIFTADFIGAGNFIPVISVEKENHMFVLKTEDRGRIFLRDDFKKDCRDFPGVKKIQGPESSGVKDKTALPVFFIRPEKIKITTKPQRNKNLFNGKVKAIIFEGPDIRLEVVSNTLGKIKIEVKNDGSLPGLKENDNLLFHWDYIDGILLEY